MDISQNQQNGGGPPVREWLWRLGIGSWLFVGIIAAIVVIDLIYVKAHHVLIPLIVAFIIGILLEPLVNVLMRRGHFPRWLAVVVTMFIIIAVIVGFFAIVIYGISTQAHQLAKQVQEGEARLRDWVGHMKISSSAVTWVTDAVKKAWPSISDGITHAIGRTASGLGSFAIGMFIGFFILIFFLGDDGRIKEFVAGHLGLPRVQGESVLAEVTSSFRGYFKGATIIAAMKRGIRRYRRRHPGSPTHRGRHQGQRRDQAGEGGRNDYLRRRASCSITLSRSFSTTGHLSIT